ncbi:MAG TPA: enoyl-CoA hydratase/isomerase family protein [Acidimicrobiales bacterium]|jgi:enoyl-CoA hydratase/carnithine racemase|nr:enoyl-CoA hydratase/isomerase family protein [Acidimicrobiales bacterium]
MDIDKRGDVAVVSLGDGPNAVDASFLADLNKALDEVEADPTVTALVTTASGKHYSNGFDLEFLGGLGDDAMSFLDDTARTLARILTLGMPTAAALNGHAFGAGAMLALAHDVRAQNAERGWFCFPEVDLHMHFMPFQLSLITRKLPGPAIDEAILTGRRYDGTDALAAGIVGASVPPGEVVDAAITLTAPYTGKARDAVGALKRQLRAETLALLP